MKCIDVIGSAGTCGLLWKKHLGDKVSVIINDPHKESCEVIKKNALKNNLEVDISNKDPCIVLHERGYNFMWVIFNGNGVLISKERHIFVEFLLVSINIIACECWDCTSGNLLELSGLVNTIKHLVIYAIMKK